MVRMLSGSMNSGGLMQDLTTILKIAASISGGRLLTGASAFECPRTPHRRILSLSSTETACGS